MLAVLACGDGDRSEAATRAEYTRACSVNSGQARFELTARDQPLGRGVQLNGFRGNFANASAGDVYSPRPGVEVLKAPVIFRGRRDVIIAVPRSHRSVLGLDYAFERRGVDTAEEAHGSVRFRACPGRRGATGYAGGLIYAGPWPACVPVFVSVGGRRPQRHLLSLGAGPCQARK